MGSASAQTHGRDDDSGRVWHRVRPSRTWSFVRRHDRPLRPNQRGESCRSRENAGLNRPSENLFEFIDKPLAPFRTIRTIHPCNATDAGRTTWGRQDDNHRSIRSGSQSICGRNFFACSKRCCLKGYLQCVAWPANVGANIEIQFTCRQLHQGLALRMAQRQVEHPTPAALTGCGFTAREGQPGENHATIFDVSKSISSGRF